MPEFRIQSIDDPRIEVYRHLKRQNLTRWSGLFIAEGTRLVERLLGSDLHVDSVFVSESHLHRLTPETIASKTVYVAPLKLLEQVIGFQFHSGMLACGVRRPLIPLFEWLPEKEKPLLLLGCPQTSDPDNLGTMIRIAAAFGADGLITGPSTADPFSRRTLRISMGNAFFLPIFESADFAADMAFLQRDRGVTAVASLLDKEAIPLAKMTRPRSLLLLMGNEDDGLAPQLAAQCDQKVIIPMSGNVDSLNVGIAAGIMLHHFTQVAAD